MSRTVLFAFGKHNGTLRVMRYDYVRQICMMTCKVFGQRYLFPSPFGWLLVAGIQFGGE